VGVQEEVGELAHAFLKAHQGIRTSEDHAAAERDAVADIVVYLADFCNAREIDFQATLEETWAKVRQRDWKKDSATAGVRADERKPEAQEGEPKP
jgi:NTP pyrophosphatase (non-canonical NTP hydrolase)